MFEIPRAEGFLYCITLKFGAYIICLIDVFFSIFNCFGFVLMLVDPNMLAQGTSKSDILWTSPESVPSVRAHLLLAVVTLIMGSIGIMGVRCDCARFTRLE